MSAEGRPKREYRSTQRDGAPVSTNGRAEGEGLPPGRMAHSATGAPTSILVRDGGSTTMARLQAWWSIKPRRDRRVWLALGGLVLAVLAWLYVWQPLERDIARLEAARHQSQQQRERARLVVEEITRLQRTTAPTPVAWKPALERALPRLAARPDALQIEWRDKDARIIIDATTVPALAAWLEALQRDTGIRVLEATLTGRVEPGLLRAELTLGR